MHVGQDGADQPDDGGLVGKDAHDPLQWKAIGWVSFGECLAVHTEDLADGRPLHAAAPLTQTPPLGGRSRIEYAGVLA